MKAYWVCVYEKIDNVEKLKEYAVKAKPTVEKFSGKFNTTSPAVWVIAILSVINFYVA